MLVDQLMYMEYCYSFIIITMVIFRVMPSRNKYVDCLFFYWQ